MPYFKATSYLHCFFLLLVNNYFTTSSLSSEEAPCGKFLNNGGRAGNDGKRETLPNNVSKMAPDFRGRLVLVTFLINIYTMVEHAVVQEEELLSLSMRPFQQA